MKNKVIKCNKLTISNSNPFTLIAGPCQLENEKHALDVASKLKEITEKLNMFAIKATYFKDKNLIELFGNVKVIRDNEIILGDHAKINTLTQSYKVVSKDSTKVKILINKSDE